MSLKDNGTITETTHENMMKLTEGTLGVSAECLRVVIPPDDSGRRRQHSQHRLHHRRPG
ncbi:MAG: hypothetical protein ACLTSG_11230 [Lachnospiraceae bacterium]